MADSVLFDGSDDTLTASKGDWAGTGAFSIAVCLKSTGTLGTEVFLSHDSSAHDFYHETDGTIWWFISSGNYTTSSNAIVADRWSIVGITYSGSGTTFRFHIYDETQGWLHENGAATGSPAPWSSLTNVLFGEVGSTGNFDYSGNILIAGFADSQFSDGTMETLSDGYAAWIAASFDEGLRFTATTGLSTFTGGSMAQNGGAGKTVDTGDVPSWWDDTLFSLVEVDPDADTTTTGWTTTPLFSKINDDSDSTFITATLA